MDINIITSIYESDKTKVYLVSLEGANDKHPSFAVLKKHQGIGGIEFYRRIADLQSVYFPVVYDMWEEAEVTCILEEYVSGHTLREILDMDSGLQVADVLSFVTQICTALGELHGAIPPIIHRDIKPDNIIVTKGGSIKLIDFDASREYKETKNNDTVLLGTKEYASPEQFGFMQTDTRTDIYSLGIVLSELMKHSDIDKHLAKRMQRIVDRATMFDPNQRYSNVKEMLKDIRKLAKNSFGLSKLILGMAVLFIGCAGIIVFHNHLTEKEQEVTAERSTFPEEEILSEILMVETDELQTDLAENDELQNDVIENNELQTEETQLTVLETGTNETVELVDIEYPKTVSLEDAYKYVSIADEVHAKYPGIMSNWDELYTMESYATEDTEMYSMNQDTFMGREFVALRFFKAHPRDIYVYDDRLEGMEISFLCYEAYSESGDVESEGVILHEGDYERKVDNIVTLSKEFLNTLKPGGYTFKIKAKGDNPFDMPFYLIVHAEDEKIDNFRVCIFNEIVYYSSDSQNDVAFFIQNTPYPIAKVEVNGKVLSEEDYQLVNDGFGIVVHPEFLEQYEEMQSLDFIFTMTSGQKASGRVIYLKHFEGE